MPSVKDKWYQWKRWASNPIEHSRNMCSFCTHHSFQQSVLIQFLRPVFTQPSLGSGYRLIYRAIQKIILMVVPTKTQAHTLLPMVTRQWKPPLVISRDPEVLVFHGSTTDFTWPMVKKLLTLVLTIPAIHNPTPCSIEEKTKENGRS